MTPQEGQLLFLGTGGSMGIPVIGCSCEVCKSSSPFNKRTRSAAYLTVGSKHYLIDVGPDFRMQALCHAITQIDGLLLTHAHYDHTAGLDDLRVFSQLTKQKIPCLLSRETLNEVQLRFGYLFQDPGRYPATLTRLDVRLLPDERGTVDFEGLRVHYFTYRQLGMSVNGFRFGDLAYVSDIRDYPESIFEDLKGVRQLILSALRYTPNPMHFTIDDAIAFARRVGAEQTWLTHLAHDLEHEKTNAALPSDIQLAYDGLVINFTSE